MATILCCVALGALAVVGGNEPFGWGIPALVLTGCVAVQFRWPHGWLFVVPALLPVIDLVPLTGNLLATESDQLLLAVAIAGYARLALGRNLPSVNRHGASMSLLGSLVILGLALSYAVSAAKGFLPYGLPEDQLAGYHSRWNSLRVAKGFFLPLLLLPLLLRALREEEEGAANRLAYGLLAGLAGVIAFAVYERLAYTGFTDFASDYRITASFWEMSVGGAALDGWLALTVPICAWAVLRSRSLPGQMATLILAALTSYVCLVTFSRGVYAGCLASLVVGVLAWMSGGSSVGQRSKGIKGASIVAGALLSVCLVFLMLMVFRTGGYRTLAAFILLVAATHVAAVAVHRCRPSVILGGVLVMLLGGAMSMSMFFAFDKGAYVAFALIAGSFAWTALSWHRQPTLRKSGFLLGLWGSMAVACALVALHWGDEVALVSCVRAEAVPVVGLLVLALRAQPPLAWHPRQTMFLLGGVGVLALGVVVTGGYYMESRFSNSSKDLGTRESHWKGGISWLDSDTEWAIGKGLGRFPETFYWRGPAEQRSGVHAFPMEGNNRFLRLVTALHPLSWGDVLRLLQPVSRSNTGPLEVTADVRTAQDVRLYVEICDRHLIYAQGCTAVGVPVKAMPGRWQTVKATLPGMPQDGGPWYAPRVAWFAVALDTSGAMADVDNLRMKDASGRDILRNGDFSRGSDFWFFSSDRDHLPWHIKSVFLNMLFDQGILGLAAFSLLFLAVALRMLALAGQWPLAPFLFASLAGFFTVGLFDSLVDVPRLAMLYYLLCFTMLLVRPRRLADSRAREQGAQVASTTSSAR